jgi:hypothetical protein
MWMKEWIFLRTLDQREGHLLLKELLLAGLFYVFEISPVPLFYVLIEI